MAMLSNLHLYLGVSALITIFFGFKILRYGMRPKNFPPGPPTVPALGNLLQVPTKNLHLFFDEVAKSYGPIVSLKLGGTDLILLNDPAVVRDLLEKRSGIYSARPDTYIREFVGNRNIAFRDNDETWRKQRKMYHLRLNTKVANQYIPYQSFDSKQLLDDLLREPERFVDHLQRYTTSVASTVLYGMRTSTADNGYVKDLMDWMEKTGAAQNFQVVDFYGFLRPLYRIMPARFSTYKRTLLEINEIEDRLFFKLLNVAKDNIEKGKVYPSFIRDMLLADDRMTDVEIANNAAHGFGAATDTQWNTSLGFIKAMILYPEVQAEAHRELDCVIGSERLPEWEDRDKLPYIRAIIEESFRWMPTTLTAAVPHAVTRDDFYNGYKIPQGAMLMMNVWTLNNNNETTQASNARDFDPTRHTAEFTLVESNSISPESTKRSNFTFGAGRRVCPGFHVAQRGLFVAVSRMLWGFEFSRRKDEMGNLIPIDRDALTQGLIVQPAPFVCDIMARSEGHKRIIREAWKEAQNDLDDDGNFTEEFFQKVFPGK